MMAQFSANRLNGEPVAADVRALLMNNDELYERTEIRLNWEEGWAPWLDTSNLRAAEDAEGEPTP